jgi:hypothetical protein
MSIVDHEGKPIGYGWNDIAASEAVEKNPTFRLISDEEFETRFPEITRASQSARKGAGAESVSSAR